MYPFSIYQVKGDKVEELYSPFPFTDALLLNALVTKNPCSVTVEIGSWTGQSSCILGLEVKKQGGKMFCIDNFKGSPESNQVEYTEGVKDVLTRNLERFDLDKTVTILEGSSDSFVDMFEDESIDFMFIDADHRYSQVKRDLVNWFPKMKVGGVMTGHDFDSLIYNEEYVEKDYVEKVHHGVVKALSEVVQSGVAVGYAKPATIWWINKNAEIAGATLSPQPQSKPDKVGGKEGRDEQSNQEETSSKAGTECIRA